MYHPAVESLESRTLFAGVTLVTHGRLGHLWGFDQTLADDITARLGGPTQVAQYILTVTPYPADVHLIPSITHVAGTATPQSTTTGEIVLFVDYTSVDANPSYSLNYIGSVVADAMMNSTVDGIHLTDVPIHEIAVSRGTGLIDEIAHSLGQSGVWVDQETYTDPNPIGVMNDAPPTIYDNVAFVDNYWRTDGNPDNHSTDGRPVDGAYNLNVWWLDSHMQYWGLAHLVPEGYYMGTIDLTGTNGGEGPIYSDWYGNTPDKPARDQTGFLYSRIVGGTRPLSGVWAASGGTGVRTPAGQQGPQWANMTDLSLANGATSAIAGPMKVSYLYQDRDSASTVRFYLDHDQNPYNGNCTNRIGTVALSESDTVTSVQSTISAAGITPGQYWLLALITDTQGHTRFEYSRQISITPAPKEPSGSTDSPHPPVSARLGTDHILRIVGTSHDDVIKISRSPSIADRLVVNVDGTSTTFVMSGVQKIIAYGEAGNDAVSVNEKYGAIFTSARLLGGDGNDTLIGGSGNDLLFGEAGSDSLLGGAGRDHLDGGADTDRLYGQSAGDWFVGSKTEERMDLTKVDELIP